MTGRQAQTWTEMFVYFLMTVCFFAVVISIASKQDRDAKSIAAEKATP